MSLPIQEAAALAGRLLLAAIFLHEAWTPSSRAIRRPWPIREAFGVPGSCCRSPSRSSSACGLLILLGYYTRAAALVLAGFCVATAVLFHTKFGSPQRAPAFREGSWRSPAGCSCCSRTAPALGRSTRPRGRQVKDCEFVACIEGDKPMIEACGYGSRPRSRRINRRSLGRDDTVGLKSRAEGASLRSGIANLRASLQEPINPLKTKEFQRSNLFGDRQATNSLSPVRTRQGGSAPLSKKGGPGADRPATRQGSAHPIASQADFVGGDGEHRVARRFVLGGSPVF